MQNMRGLTPRSALGPRASSPSHPWRGIRGAVSACLGWMALGAIVTTTMGCGSRQEARSAVYYSGGTPDSNRGVLTAAAAKTARSCTKDESCSFGEYCVRPQYSMTGYCAIPIDAYGKPTLYPQQLPSISPYNRGDCRNVNDCPIGLHCDDQIGSTAHCVR